MNRLSVLTTSPSLSLSFIMNTIRGLAACLILAQPAHALESSTKERLAEVDERSKLVMPFRMEKTTHLFIKTDDVGIQKVIVKNRLDAEQITLIRRHLMKIAGDFRHGDFSDPVKIHGAGMSGIEELKNARPGLVKTSYSSLPDGAQLVYSIEDKKLVNAVHRWFDPQLSDHGRHAMPSHLHYSTQGRY